MPNSTSPSGLRRGLVALLSLYALAMIFYLVGRFMVYPNLALFLLVHNTAPYLFAGVLVGLGLALLLRHQRLSFLYGLLLLVGILWVGIPLLPKAVPNLPPNSTELHLITANVYVNNTDLSRVEEWVLAYAPDVVALQEVASELPLLTEAYTYHDFSDTEAVFSNYPIVSSDDIVLGGELQQRVVLDIGGTLIALYNIHLLMPLNEQEDQFLLLRYDETRRNAQIAELLGYLQLENLPFVLAGDFNMSDYSPTYDLLRVRYNDAYRDTQWGIGATWPAGASEELGDWLPRLFRLDYVWTSAQITPLGATVGKAVGSDHLPMWVSLAIPAP